MRPSNIFFKFKIHFFIALGSIGSTYYVDAIMQCATQLFNGRVYTVHVVTHCRLSTLYDGMVNVTAWRIYTKN